jgi:hypothetical protein
LSTSQSARILTHLNWPHCTLGVEQDFAKIMPRWPNTRSPEKNKYKAQNSKQLYNAKKGNRPNM